MNRQFIRVTHDLVTSAAVVKHRLIYEVETDSPLYQDSLLHIGFMKAGEGRFTRNLSVWGDVAAIHRRFAANLQNILLQTARRAPADWQDALRLFLTRVEGTRLEWFLYGSGALAVRGVDVVPGDLDFWVNDADLAGRIFADLLIEPVTDMRHWVANKIGRAYSNCIIEWLSDVNPAVDDQSHEQDPATHSATEFATWHGYTVPVAPLLLQLATLDRRGLTERAAKVREHLGPI